MSIALSEFWTRLVRSGIADAEGCRKLAAAFTKANSGTPPTDARAVARFMVKRGHMTRFQARALLTTPPRELRAGSFLIRSDQAAPPLSRWFEASCCNDGRLGVLLNTRISTDNHDFIDQLKLHQSARCATLQKMELELHSQSAFLFSALPSGHILLASRTAGQVMPPAEVCRVGIAVALALEALHARSLFHGEVRSDRVWMCDDGSVILLRDPSASAHGELHQGWLDQLESPALYAAPELQDDRQGAGVAIDIYSLGCLMFSLATGRMPYRGLTDAQIHSAHRSQVPPELAEAVRLAEAGNPLLRVIAFAMAKNPAARFATAAQLSNALQAAQQLLSRERGSDIESIEPPPAPVAPSGQESIATKTATAISRPVDSPRRARRSDEPRRAKSTGDGKTGIATTAPVELATVNVSPRQAGLESKHPPAVFANEASEAKPQGATDPVLRSVQGDMVPTTAIKDDGPSPPIATDDRALGSERVSRRRKKRKSKAPIVLGSLCIAVLMLVVGLIATDRDDGQPERRSRPPIPKVIPPVTNRTAQAPPEATTTPTLGASRGYELVSDDRLLFVPPYRADSTSPPLDLLPPGPAAIITARLASIARNQSVSDLMEGISTGQSGLLEIATARTRMPLESIERLTAVLHPGTNGWPEVSFTVELNEAIKQEVLIADLNVIASRTRDGAIIFTNEQSDGDAYYWRQSDDELVSQFALGPLSRIQEVAATEGNAIPLPRLAQSLWNGASGESDFVALFTPNFLFADGRELLDATAPELSHPLKRLMQPDVAAALISVNLSDSERVYVEAMFAPSGGISEAALMRKVSDAVDGWPTWADQFILESVPDPSWRLLASRLPSMMRFASGQVRFGISDGRVVANAYLPSRAFPQLILATVLAMNTPANADTIASTEATSGPLSVDQILDREMSVSFDQESLEFALDAIVNAFKQSLPAGSTMPTVRIIGSDLQLMGITQNQQVRDFVKKDLPLRRVLTDLVVGANPDKSAVGPDDPKQTLIWVVADDRNNPGKQEILITTRQASLSNEYELPSEFLIDIPADQ